MMPNGTRSTDPATTGRRRLSNASLALWPGLAGLGFSVAMLAGAGGHPVPFVVACLAGSLGLLGVGGLTWAMARWTPTGVPVMQRASDLDDDLDDEFDEFAANVQAGPALRRAESRS
jgi:hypothetical protein